MRAVVLVLAPKAVVDAGIGRSRIQVLPCNFPKIETDVLSSFNASLFARKKN